MRREHCFLWTAEAAANSLRARGTPMASSGGTEVVSAQSSVRSTSVGSLGPRSAISKLSTSKGRGRKALGALPVRHHELCAS